MLHTDSILKTTLKLSSTIHTASHCLVFFRLGRNFSSKETKKLTRHAGLQTLAGDRDSGGVCLVLADPEPEG